MVVKERQLRPAPPSTTLYRPQDRPLCTWRRSGRSVGPVVAVDSRIVGRGRHNRCSFCDGGRGGFGDFAGRARLQTTRHPTHGAARSWHAPGGSAPCRVPPWASNCRRHARWTCRRRGWWSRRGTYTHHRPPPPAASTTMYLKTLRPLGGPGGRPRPACGRRRPARRSYIRSWCQTTRWPYARPRPPNGVNPSAAGLTVARRKRSCPHPSPRVPRLWRSRWGGGGQPGVGARTLSSRSSGPFCRLHSRERAQNSICHLGRYLNSVGTQYAARGKTLDADTRRLQYTGAGSASTDYKQAPPPTPPPT